jgi:CheY-like chemotaxis protein
VLDAADGAKALALLAGHRDPVDLIFSDVVMPGMRGPELANRVAETRPGTAVLLMSGYPGDVVARNGRFPTGAHFIGKPFTAAELTAKVREAIGR